MRVNGEFFTNRAEAGRELASELQKYRDSDAIILALPRGGVGVAKEIAKELHLPLDLVVVRKIGHPYNPEFAIAAVSENGDLAADEEELQNVDPDWLKKEIEKEQSEARRRRETYLPGKKQLDLKDKLVILVDDGLATGLSMLAAIEMVKHQKPSKIVVAVPVTPPDTAERIQAQSDEFFSLLIPEHFLGGVGAYYEDFQQVSDQEVIQIMNDPQKDRHAFQKSLSK